MRILLIEDEVALSESIKTGLEDEKFAVDIRRDGIEGFEQAIEEEYDLIILDRMLPHMDGISICKQLREKKNYTPIVMLTAMSTTENKIEGLDAGADDYVSKPFLFAELLARIRSLIRRATTNDVILEVDTLKLDPKTHLVSRINVDVVLTAKEYGLLEFLMRHPNQIVTREQITNHVWDYDHDSLSNTIEVLIKRVREKIDRNFPREKALIHTVRGLGYKIEG